MIRPLLCFVSLVFAGLFAGFLVGILVFELSLRQFDAGVYAQTQQVALVAIPTLASVLLLPAIIATAAIVVPQLRTRGRAFWPVLTALVLLLVALVVTLTVNVPINLTEARWDPASPPEDWAAIRDRWQLAHAARTLAAVLAFTSLAVAGLGRPAAAAVSR